MNTPISLTVSLATLLIAGFLVETSWAKPQKIPGTVCEVEYTLNSKYNFGGSNKSGKSESRPIETPAVSWKGKGRLYLANTELPHGATEGGYTWYDNEIQAAYACPKSGLVLKTSLKIDQGKKNSTSSDPWFGWYEGFRSMGRMKISVRSKDLPQPETVTYDLSKEDDRNAVKELIQNFAPELADAFKDAYLDPSDLTLAAIKTHSWMESLVDETPAPQNDRRRNREQATPCSITQDFLPLPTGAFEADQKIFEALGFFSSESPKGLLREFSKRTYQTAQNRIEDKQYYTTLDILRRLIENPLRSPEKSQFKTIFLKNSSIAQYVGAYPELVSLLVSAGFNKEDDKLVLDDDSTTKARLERAYSSVIEAMNTPFHERFLQEFTELKYQNKIEKKQYDKSLQILRRAIENPLRDPQNAQYRELSLENQAVVKNMSGFPALLKFLEVSGFKKVDSKLVLESNSDTLSRLKLGLVAIDAMTSAEKATQ